MSGKISQSFIDDLINRTDLVALIDSYVPLRKKGANYTACCPFHQEKTPSFSVSPNKQIYHCFGCGAGGNALRFLMDYERLGFTEALALLAKQAGLELPIENKNYESSSALYDVMSKAAEFYHQQLKTSQEAIDYFKSRGITGIVAKQYQLGFSPAGWNNLTDHCGRDEATKKMLLQTGLIIQKDNNKSYDRFRSRIMFPIRDVKGRVIAFGGRVLINEEPKYLNSPETVLFHKGRELYGLYEAKRALREINYFIVVEGYMDVLALVQHGLNNAVGTLGTATTADHLNKLLRYTKHIVFCFDGDRAGKEAAWRALQVALPYMEDGVKMSFMFLPEKDDPDSFIRRMGKEVFLEEVKNAQTFSDFLYRHLTETMDLSTLEGKASLSHIAMPLLEKMPEGAFKQMMYERLSRLVPLDTRQLRSLSKKSVPVIKEKITENKRPVKAQNTVTSLMRMVVMLLIQNPRLRVLIPRNASIAEWDHVESELFKEMLGLLDAHPSLSAPIILEYWRDKAEYQLIAELLVKEHLIPEENIEAEFAQIIVRLEQQYQERKIEKILLKAKTQGLTAEEKVALQELIVLSKA